MNFEDYDKKIGRIIKLIRIDKKIKQGDIAKAIKIDPSKLCHIEAGDQSLTFGQFMIIANQLEMNPVEILKLIQQKHPLSPAEENNIL